MAKNLVILLDGTSNEIETDRSNILRLYGTLEKSERQLVYYDPGVGTFGSDNAWSRWVRKGSEVLGMATGWGIDLNVEQAYRFLVENYRIDDEGIRDRIYILGFSRGAYTARVLAGFIHAFGLIETRNLNLTKYAYRAYKRVSERGDENSFSEIRLHERVLRPDRPPIRFLGLFDTVASVIEWGRFGIRLRKHAFTKYNTSVESVRHAVAIAERRCMFRPQLWPTDQTYCNSYFNGAEDVRQDAKEVWFSGVHGDVGGGYPEVKSALAKIPLHWMIQESEAQGLYYRSRTVNELVLGAKKDDDYVAPDGSAKPQNSMSLGWRILEYLPQPKSPGSRRADLFGWTLPRGEWRTIPDDATIHNTVSQQPVPAPNMN